MCLAEVTKLAGEIDQARIYVGWKCISTNWFSWMPPIQNEICYAFDRWNQDVERYSIDSYTEVPSYVTGFHFFGSKEAANRYGVGGHVVRVAGRQLSAIGTQAVIEGGESYYPETTFFRSYVAREIYVCRPNRGLPKRLRAQIERQRAVRDPKER